MLAQKFLFLLVLILAPGALWSQQDPLLRLGGTWQQNFAKSTPVPTPLPRSRIHIYEPAGKDRMKHTSEEIDANGEKTVNEGIDTYDGKEHPDDSARADTVLHRRVDSYTTQQIMSKDGKIVRFLERVVSPDGRTLTIRQIGADAQGRAVISIGTYKKQ